jgi:hypothetical protein
MDRVQEVQIIQGPHIMEKALPHSIEILVGEYVEQVIEVGKLDVVPLACRGCLVTSSHDVYRRHGGMKGMEGGGASHGGVGIAEGPSKGGGRRPIRDRGAGCRGRTGKKVRCSRTEMNEWCMSAPVSAALPLFLLPMY